METALLNTLVGMGIVFIVLIFISGIIYMFKYVNSFQNSQAQKQVQPVIKAAPQPVVTEMVKEETDDSELVAVITAAVVAFRASLGESAPADGLVVRSIRRRGFAK